MSKLLSLHCYGCGFAEVISGDFTCSMCGEPMSINVHAKPAPEIFSTPPSDLWHYMDLLPVSDRDKVVSLGEGATRLIGAPGVAEWAGCAEILLKNESSNPTGSFKDRQISVAISHAREEGRDTVAVVSSGNVACAASAYAARAGMRAVLLMHGHAAPQKLAQAAVYGGTVVRVDTPSASAVFDLCIAACERFGWAHLSTAGMYNPWNVEGAKTIAYELYQQTGGDLPDWIVAPVGGGGLLGGVWRGFLDLKDLGLIERIPRLVGVQAEGCAPLVKAVAEGMPFLETLKHPWPNPQTIAGGIADDIIFDGHTALPAIRTTGGAAVAVSDEEIVDGILTLARREGVWCEPTTGVVVAALKKLPGLEPRHRVACIITGNGMKDPGALRGRVAGVATIEPDLDQLAGAIGN